jgi:hypothetical protein
MRPSSTERLAIFCGKRYQGWNNIYSIVMDFADEGDLLMKIKKKS